jgi:cyclic pyranopterin phosphate synthase
MHDLTHLDAHGRATMVDITGKPSTSRMAEARCEVVTTAGFIEEPSNQRTVAAIEHARIAGIQAAKATSSLIPLCHPLWIDRIELAVLPHKGGVTIRAITGVTGRTGVEMEALTGCALAALTLLSDLFPVDPEAAITGLSVWQKSGGRSGSWHRPDAVTASEAAVVETIESRTRGGARLPQAGGSVSTQGLSPSG